jgi:crossover junction endodeoxyribonuclease RuvC
VIVGIDPGLSGALFFLDPSAPESGEAIDMPVHNLARGGKNKRELDVVGLIRILATHHLTHAFVEQVGSMPGQGVSSVFAFGKCYGIILGVLAARSIPLTLVAPVRWK